MPEPKYTAKDWDEVRTAFASSIMVDTQVSSLAQNLDGPVWPVKSKDETPAKYIDLSFEEAVELLALKGQSADKLDLLISILKETLAFDDPFGDMVEQTEAASIRDNPLLKNMTRIGVPENFPIALTALGPDTVEFCKLEHLKTLGEFAVFAQGMSQNVIVGGDFRKESEHDSISIRSEDDDGGHLLALSREQTGVAGLVGEETTLLRQNVRSAIAVSTSHGSK